MGKATVYSAADVQATLAGQTVDGLWDGDDAIQVAPGADSGSGLVGMQGDALFSMSTDRSATITLRLMHTSTMHATLSRLEAAQKSGGALSRGFSFNLIDVGSGEGVTAERTYIMRKPTLQKGKNATQREWVLWAAEAIDTPLIV